MAAAVATPDPVPREKVCLCVVPRLGSTVALEDVRESMHAAGVAKFGPPERLETSPRRALPGWTRGLLVGHLVRI